MILKEWIAEREVGDYKLSPAEEEILNSFNMISEGTFWSATKKFVNKMQEKMVIFGGAVSLVAVVALIATLIATGTKILDRIKKVKNK